MAWNVKISSEFPVSMVKGEKGTVVSRITSSNTEPESVWDSSDSMLSTSLFSKEGTYIGQNKLDGMVFGCYEYSGFITYAIQVETSGTVIVD